MGNNILDTVFEGHPPITHEQAREAAQDLLNHFFKNEPRKGGGVSTTRHSSRACKPSSSRTTAPAPATMWPTSASFCSCASSRNSSTRVISRAKAPCSSERSEPGRGVVMA